MSSSNKTIEYGFAIVNLIQENMAQERRPIGVVAWDQHRRWHSLRLLREDENTGRISMPEKANAKIAEEQIRGWAGQRKVPYCATEVDPYQSDFWSAVRRVMTTSIQLDEPRAMEPMKDPDVQIEHLFEAIVQPRTSAGVRRQRLDGAVTKALGPAISKAVKGKATFRAFGNIEETVLRGTSNQLGHVIVEGLNLCGPHARQDADALVSRILRIFEGTKRDKTSVIIGYLASPGGLNGESHMKKWIEAQITTNVYDLSVDASQLRTKTSQAMEEIGVKPQLSMGIR